jgi:hypothetical protein
VHPRPCSTTVPRSARGEGDDHGAHGQPRPGHARSGRPLGPDQPETKQDDHTGRPPGPPDAPSDPSDELLNRIKEGARGSARQAEDLDDERGYVIRIDNLITGGSFRVAGDFVGGDKEVRGAGGTADGEAIAGLAASLELEKLEAVFVEPTWHSRAARILDQQRLVVLRGPAGSGRRAMALHLLKGQDAKRVVELSPDTEPAKLATYPFARQFGYLIDTLLPEPAKQLSSFMLRRLGAVLGDRNSHLVLTIDHRPEVPPDAAHEYLVDCVDMPDGAAMLERHLDWYLRGTGASPGEHLEVGVAGVVEYLRLHPRPASVDRLARLLRPVAMGKGELAAALRQAGKVPGEQVASIFADDPDLPQWSLVVALAVLHRASYQTVLSAAELLAEHLQPDEEDGGKPAAWNPGIPRLQRVSQAKARLVDDQEMTQFGLVRVERVEFEHPELQPVVLDHIWQRYDQLRRPLLDWPGELGREDDREMQIGVATAVGYLLSNAFRHLFNEVLLPGR